MKKLGVSLLTVLILGLCLSVRSALAAGEVKPESADAPAVDGAGKVVEPLSSEGYSDKAATLKETTAKTLELTEVALKTKAAVSIADLLRKVDSAATYYSNLHGTCVKTQATASWLCREETSPQLQDTLNSINPMLALFNTVAVKDSCDSFGKVMAMAQAGLTAYTAACSAARASCEGSCATVYNNIGQIKKLSANVVKAAQPCTETVIDTPETHVTYMAQKSACNNLNEFIRANWNQNVVSTAETETNIKDATLPKSIASKNKACTYTYANMLVSAGTGILSVLRSMKQADACSDNSSGTSDAGTVAADLRAKCEKAENAQMPECLCLANPRLPGCANALQKAGDSSTSNFSALSSPNAGAGSDKSGAGLDLSGGDSGRDPASDLNKSGDSAGGVGAPTGGGAGLGGSGGGFGGGGAAGAGGAEKKGLNANILGGSSGGGGGGGSWGAGGSSSDSKLRPYLPGGEKDPNKMAGQQNWTKEVTGQGGKSNWEKVRDRYRDNNSSLLNN